MIRVSALYPATAGASFDHEYYEGKHIPMVREKLGEALRALTVERGIGDGIGGPAPFVAAAHLDFDSAEAFAAAIAPVAGEILGDVANYTSIQPVMLMSEIVEAWVDQRA